MIGEEKMQEVVDFIEPSTDYESDYDMSMATK